MHTGAVSWGYLGIVLVLVIGTAVVGYGWLADRAATKRQLAALDLPPDTAIPGLPEQAQTPIYLSEHEALRPTATNELTEPDRAEIAAALEVAPNQKHGHAAAEFVTDPPTGWCVVDQPQVLVLAEELEQGRELLPALRLAAGGRPLVLIAPAMSDAALATFRVNVAQRKIAGVVVLISGAKARYELCALTGAAPVDRRDLQADYLPASALGSCGRWVSTSQELWLLDAPET